MKEAQADKKEKKPVQILRERCGGVSEALQKRHRRHRKIQRQIKKALEDGPRTVPEIAQRTGLPSHEVLWHLMSMKKYGSIVEGEEKGSYYEYGLRSGARDEEAEP